MPAPPPPFEDDGELGYGLGRDEDEDTLDSFVDELARDPLQQQADEAGVPDAPELRAEPARGRGWGLLDWLGGLFSKAEPTRRGRRGARRGAGDAADAGRSAAAAPRRWRCRRDHGPGGPGIAVGARRHRRSRRRAGAAGASEAGGRTPPAPSATPAATAGATAAGSGWRRGRAARPGPIVFAPGSAALPAGAGAQLEQVLAQAKAQGAVIRILGEAESPALALDRARAVGLALVGLGARASDLEMTLAPDATRRSGASAARRAGVALTRCDRAAVRGRRRSRSDASSHDPQGQDAMRQPQFHRIRRLPPYVFSEVNTMKAAARAAGHDIIDLGMGNPDGPTPQPIVDKLIEAIRNPRTHRYSTSRGIPGLRRAHAAYYQRRFGVRARPRERDRGDARLEGGPRQSRPGDHRARRRDPGAQPELSDPSLRLHHRRGRDPPRADHADRRPAGRAGAGDRALGAAADRDRAQLPVQSDRAGGRSRLLSRGGRLRAPPRDLHPLRPRLCRDLFRRPAAALDPGGRGRQGGRGRVHLAQQDLQHAGLADRLRRRQSGS